jgi:hypothetical protein
LGFGSGCSSGCSSYPRLRRFFERVAARRGVQEVVVAVARKLAVSIYYVLKRNEPYRGKDARLRRRKVYRFLGCVGWFLSDLHVMERASRPVSTSFIATIRTHK